MRISLQILLPILLLSSCNHKESVDTEIQFHEEISLSADSVTMDIILKPGNIYYSEPYVIINDLETSEGYHYAVFDSSLKYLYSFCDRGNGPKECLMPSVVKNMPQGEFMVRDHATDTYHVYQLTDTGAISIRKFHSESFNNNESLWEINRISDDRFLAKGVAPRRAIRRLIDLEECLVIDSLEQAFDLSEIMGKDYYTEFDDCWIVAGKNRFACAYYFINRIEFGSINDSTMTIDKVLGATVPPEFHRFTDKVLNGRYKYNVDYNPVYYEWLFGSHNKVYGSFVNLPWGDISQHASQIHVFTYDSTPERKYNLDIPLSSFIVIDDTRIIGLNSNRSDDHIFTYTINN